MHYANEQVHAKSGMAMSPQECASAAVVMDKHCLKASADAPVKKNNSG
ncbi:MAG: hypothetical protein ACREJD_04355 [Phycisphaerales bacterium]